MLLDLPSSSPSTPSVVFSVVGCYVNLAADPLANRIFLPGIVSMMEYNVVSKLIRMARRMGLKDVNLCAVIFKVLSNLAFSVGGSGETFGSCFFDRSDLTLLGDTVEELLDIAGDAHGEAVEEGGEEGGRTIYSDFLQAGGPLLESVRETEVILGIGGEEGEEKDGTEEEEEKYHK